MFVRTYKNILLVLLIAVHIVMGRPQRLFAQDIEKFKQMREIQLAAKKKDISKIMNECKIHTAKSDVENRNMVTEVLDGMGDTCKAYNSSVNFDDFMTDIKKAARVVDQDKIWDETTKISLEKSVEGLLSLHMRVVNKTGILTSVQAQNIICGQVKLLCAAGRPEFQVIKKSIAAFLERNKKSPIQYLDATIQESLKADFNDKVELANQTCALTKKKYDEIKAAYSCAPDFPSVKKAEPMTQSKCEGILEQAYIKHKQLESMARESIELNMQLLVSSELGPLFATKSFRKSIGTLNPDFVYNSCMQGSGTVLNKAWHKSINEGRSELYTLALEELKNIQEKRIVPPRFVDKEKEIEKYLKTNPLTISELLKRSPDQIYAKAICHYIKDIHRSDKISNYIETGVMAVGVVSSIAFGFATGGAGFAVVGPGATALAAVSIGSTALVIGKNAVEYHSQLRQDQANRQSIATKQRSLDKGIEALETSDKKKEELLTNMKWGMADLVLESAGFGLSARKAQVIQDMVVGTNQTAKIPPIKVPLTPDEIAKFGPRLPKDASKISAVYPETNRIFLEVFPETTADELKRFISSIRKQYAGKVKDHEIAIIIEKFNKGGGKTTSDLTKKFQSLVNLRQKHIDLFQPDGAMNAAAFKKDGDLTKLAYLDELERNGVPLRDTQGELILSVEKTVVRQKIANLPLRARIEAITKEMNFLARKKNPCGI